MPRPPQAAHRRNPRQKRHRRRAQHLLPGPAIQPIRIDRRHHPGRRPLRRMVIQHDHLRPLQRLQHRSRRRPAIHAHHQRRTLRHQPPQRRQIRPIPLGNPVRHIRQHRTPQRPQQRRHQRRTARPIHVVITKHRHRLAAAHRPRQPLGRHIHVNQPRRVRQQRPQRRIKEIRRILDPNPPRRQQPCHHLVQPQPLRDRQARARLALAPNPTPPGNAALDA